MFKDSSNNQNAKGGETNKISETIIGQSVKVDGDFKSGENLYVEGEVNGSLDTKGDLKVGKKAVINANVNAKNAYVSGIIKGNLKIEEVLEIKDTAVIDGDIETNTLIIDRGAKVNGNIKMGNVEKSTLEEKEVLAENNS